MVPASHKHYTARILEWRDFSEDLWVIRVDPGEHSSSELDNTRRWGGTTGTRELSVRIQSCLRRVSRESNFSSISCRRAN